jgi:hypothetical protein
VRAMALLFFTIVRGAHAGNGKEDTILDIIRIDISTAAREGTILDGNHVEVSAAAWAQHSQTIP